jgi:hypothetical protein
LYKIFMLTLADHMNKSLVEGCKIVIRKRQYSLTALHSIRLLWSSS